MSNKKIACPDCGNAQVNHTLEWTSSVLEKFFKPLSKPADWIWRTIEPVAAGPLFNKITPAIMDGLVYIRLATYALAPDAKTGGRSRVMWEEAMRRGIRVREFRLFYAGREAFIAEYNGKTKTFMGLPRPGSTDSPSIRWMDDKKIMREKFAAAGIPVAQGGDVHSWRKTKKLFKKLTPPVIIKPELGSRSRHTTVHIDTLDDLRRAFKCARVLSPYLVMEEEHHGFVHRGTLVGGKVAGILRREPASVTGDGVHSVAELIEIENKNPLRQGPIFHTIVMTDEARAELTRNGLSIGSIPKKDHVVALGQKASRGVGGGATDMTDEAHPDNIAMLEHVAKVLGDSLVGVDFMMEDVTRSWREQSRCGVIECNSMPFIDLHHHPLKGKVRDVAGMVWDLTFPDSKPKQK